MDTAIVNAVAVTFTVTVALGLITWFTVYMIREKRKEFRALVIKEATRNVLEGWVLRDLRDNVQKLGSEVFRLSEEKKDKKPESAKVK